MRLNAIYWQKGFEDGVNQNEFKPSGEYDRFSYHFGFKNGSAVSPASWMKGFIDSCMLKAYSDENVHFESYRDGYELAKEHFEDISDFLHFETLKKNLAWLRS
ncbi:hypothetical protein J3998_08390 [Thiomicrorhabdus sp. 6S2-11]|jgi:hypothetical protein|uniref:Uncharacterized protein n=1 Tax=Thiomicrorhabdus marina TaxID=2818442 RepID=A0ABS3Q5N8_9GAMM|nr:hypothetical protein [Thiomicrorhabdus marina]MBO1927592.1 hypothetical protein [Thiomicrorhabdus marina]